jgi:hypothetical protein
MSGAAAGCGTRCSGISLAAPRAFNRHRSVDAMTQPAPRPPPWRRLCGRSRSEVLRAAATNCLKKGKKHPEASDALRPLTRTLQLIRFAHFGLDVLGDRLVQRRLKRSVLWYLAIFSAAIPAALVIP